MIRAARTGMAPSAIKAHVADVVEGVHDSGNPVVVGQSELPIASIRKVAVPRCPGSLAHLVRWVGDIESPIDEEWDATA